MLTIQILTRDNEGTVAKALESIKSLGARVLVGDLGSSDSTREICRDSGAEVLEIDWGMDYSRARNQLVAPGMNFMLEPWERLIRGHDELEDAAGNHNVLILRNGVASHELRLWSGLRFKNPVYEVLEDEGAKLLEGVALVASGWPDRRKETAQICSRWRESRPTSADPWYYSALSSLASGERKEFLGFAEKYLAMSAAGPATTFMRYRMARVMAAEGRLDRAAAISAKCLAEHPTFAEFWCLMGDLFIARGRYDKAMSMYRNAIVMGSRRRSDDSYPVEVDKYRKYPEQMIDEIGKMTKANTVYN